MESYYKFLLERAKMLKSWKEYAKQLAESAKQVLPDCKVYIFGSALRGELAGGSDVDVLIVSDNIPKNFAKRVDIKLKIEELSRVPYYHPFEIHIVNKDEAKWYFKHAGEIKQI